MAMETRERWIRGLVVALGIAIAPLTTQVCQAQPGVALQGRLISVEGKGPVLRMSNKDYRLTGKTQYLFHTLQDKRLINRQVRLEGTTRPDGALEVERLYTVRDGKLYRVRYYCEV
jgi:hypothetical protein